ncbi:MAG: glycosyltransferase, partial [Candidatus Syntrophosphaera sp.]
KKRFNIKWVADWRDPWTGIYYFKLNPPGALSLRLHKLLEKKVALNSDLNFTVSKHLAEQLPGRNNCVIYNGFDARKFDWAASIEQKSHGTFKLKYVGNLTEGQQFRPLIEIIKTSLSDVDFRLVCVGTRLTTEQQGILEELIPGKYECKGFLPHDEAIREMADSEVLLLLINYYEGSQGMLTTKLFEYIASKTPVLCLGPKGGEAEEIITQYNAGACFYAGEKQAASEYLRGLHTLWQKGRGIKNKKDVSALSSQNQALKLIEKLERLKRG